MKQQNLSCKESQMEVWRFSSEGGEQANGSADLENSFAWISNSERNFNEFEEPGQWQRIADSSISGARILDFACLKNISWEESL